MAFAWSFSTARVTGDLVDIYRGLHGEGPFSAMEADYPAGVLEAHQVHEITDHSDTYRLPIEAVMEPLVQLGLFSEEAGAVMDASYRSFSSDMVGGSFNTMYLLADRDDDGHDDSDEWWQIDSMTGQYSAASQRVPFTCVLPKPGYGFEPPYDVAIFGHGWWS